MLGFLCDWLLQDKFHSVGVWLQSIMHLDLNTYWISCFLRISGGNLSCTYALLHVGLTTLHCYLVGSENVLMLHYLRDQLHAMDIYNVLGAHRS